MGKSAKIFKRPNKKEKEVIKIQKSVEKANSVKEDIINEEPEKPKIIKKKSEPRAVNKIEAKTVHHPYKVDRVKKDNKNKDAKSKRILEGRPDYVDLMFKRTSAKKK